MSRTQTFTGLGAMGRPPPRAVATIGVFDGVHLAHRRLIRSTIRTARRLKGTSVAITFDPDPQAVLDPAHAQPVLMPIRDRLMCLRQLGVERVWIIPFTRRFARMTAEQFIRQVLIDRLHAVALIVGEAFAFGKDRRGGMEVLQALGPPHGLRVVPVRQMTYGGEPISSSRIRRLISQGGLGLAKRLLGRPPSLYGMVVPGAGRGRRLGFPTANVRLTSEVLPPQGVYAVIVREAAHPSARDPERRAWRGVMNLGVRPTFGPGPLVCEVHLLGFSGSLLRRAVSISLLARLRGERCFPSVQALRRQIHHDLARARQVFARIPSGILSRSSR